MALLDKNDSRPVHFVGIAGAGMSALAELFLRRGGRPISSDSASASPRMMFPTLMAPGRWW